MAPDERCPHAVTDGGIVIHGVASPAFLYHEYFLIQRCESNHDQNEHQDHQHNDQERVQGNCEQHVELSP